jgi:hypothetical protein
MKRALPSAVASACLLLCALIASAQTNPIAVSWTERYETLRHYVLEGRQRLQSQPLGLALWTAQGMAGWMRQWTQLLGYAEPIPTGEANDERRQSPGAFRTAAQWSRGEMAADQYCQVARGE